MDDATSATDDASFATSPVFEVLYGTAEDTPTGGLVAAFGKLLADAETVDLALRDTTIVAGTDDDQQVAVAFEVVVGDEPPFERAESVTLIAVSQADAQTNTDETDGVDIDLAPDLQGATEAVVTFHPQVWRNDYAITGSETETYGLPIEDVVMDDGTLPDGSEASETLAWHDDAPERARKWQGPFFITVDEIR
jgi:hypothetical protein